MTVVLLLPVVMLLSALSRSGRRFMLGEPLDGVRRTNATFLQRPTKALHPTADRSWWHWRPGWHRGAFRVAAFVFAVLLAAGLILEPGVTLLCLVICAGIATGYAGWKLLEICRSWIRACTWDRKHPWKSAGAALILPLHHHVYYRRPLKHALTAEMGVPPLRVRVPLDRSKAAVRVPPEFTGSDKGKEGVTRAVTSKLALEAPDPAWKLHGRKPQVTFTRSDPPPGLLTWDDVAPAIAAAGPSELLAGVGRKRHVVSVSTELDSPHFMLAMGSGGGKSNTAAFWLVQELMRGAFALILDAKWFSHPWAFKDMDAEYGQLPNIAYARSTQDLHNAMVWLGIELQRRTEEAEKAVNAKGDILAHRGDIGPRLWIVAEELNLATPRLKQFWADARSPDQPKRSPALDGLGAVAFAGRAVRMHLITIGQMLTAASLGGGDVRENMGVRCLARYSANSWKMQAGDLPMPPPSSVPGRVQVIASGAVREAQVPLMDMELARQLALSGTVTPCAPDMPGASRELLVPGRVSVSTPPEQGIVLGQSPEAPRLTIREAIGQGVFGGRGIWAVRKAVQRAEIEAAGRRGSEHEYHLSDLRAVAKGSASDS